MRRIVLIVGLFALAVSPVLAQAPAKSTEEVVLQLTRDWLSAEERADRAKLREIIADDFQGTAPRGDTVFKADVIPEEGSQSGLQITPSNLKARIFGDVAIVTAHGVQKAGEKRELRFTVVFAKRDNRWQMVAGHLAPILPRPPA